MGTLCLITFASIFYSSMTYAKVKQMSSLPLSCHSKQIDLDKFYGDRITLKWPPIKSHCSAFNISLPFWFDINLWTDLWKMIVLFPYLCWNFNWNCLFFIPPFSTDVAAAKWIQTHVLRLVAVRRLFWCDGGVRSRCCCWCVQHWSSAIPERCLTTIYRDYYRELRVRLT